METKYQHPPRAPYEAPAFEPYVVTKRDLMLIESRDGVLEEDDLFEDFN